MNAFTISRRLAIAPDTALLCATILIAPELFGGAFPWAVVVIAGLSVASLGTALWVRRFAATPVVDGVFIVIGVAWLWTCLQAVPLPSGVAHALGLGSVENAERLQGLAWAGTVPFTISYDPGATHLQILIGIAIVGGFLAARLGGPSGLRPIAMATVGSAVLLGLVGFAHRGTGADALFGMYSPRFSATHVLTPLMNNNHLGGFSLMGALIAAGLAAQESSRPKRVSWALSSVFCAIVVTWTLSRGAIGALLFGFVLLASWLVANRRSDGRVAAVPMALVGAAAVTGVVAFMGLEPILRRFETQGLDKLGVAARGFRLLEGSAWWLGVGRGAFSSAFVTHEGSLGRYTHPENLLVQWTTEWGVPVAVTLLLVLTFVLWKRFRSGEEPVIAAVCVAIFALSLQNLVDFSLEMAGVVFIVAALLGSLLSSPRAVPLERPRRLLLASFGVLLSVLAALSPRVLGSDTQSIIDRLTQYMQGDDQASFEATLRRGLALHPGEPAFALLAGTYAGMKRRPDAPRWLSIVIEEAPGWAAPHAVAAGWLFAEGRTEQALIEIREAERRQPRGGYLVLCEILTRFPHMEYIEAAAPSRDLRIAYLDRTTSCPGLPTDLLAEIDSAILQEEPTSVGPVRREAQRLVTLGRMDEAIGLLERALLDHADSENLWVALIRTQLSAGEPQQARLALEEAKSGGLETRLSLESQARVEAALGQADAMRATLTRLRGQSRGDARLIASSLILGGALEASLGNIDEALAAYTAADVASPNTPALQYAAALALKSERPTQARRLYRTLCRREPDGRACAQEARLSKDLSPAPPRGPVP